VYLQTHEVDYRPAKGRLEAWLKGQELCLVKAAEWTHWNFNNRPFWSVWVEVVGRRVCFETWGMHIYEDGEIVMVTKLEWVELKKGKKIDEPQ